MTINLSEVEFVYDFFSLPLPGGNTLIMNKVDEDFLSGDDESVVKGINIVVVPEDGSDNVYCSSVIGMSNDYFTLESGYSEYEGKVLTTDNMKYCTMEISDDEQ